MFCRFEKAFDRVNWVKMLDILKEIGVDWRDRRLVRELYMKEEAMIRIGGEDSKPCMIGRGVRQGCPLSPLLFTAYVESMMMEAYWESQEGIKIGGQLLRDIRFADDQGMVGRSEKELQSIMDNLNGKAAEYDMKINVKKTKVMVVSRNVSVSATIVVDGQPVEQVKQFKYLGCWLTEDGRDLVEIKTRIGMAKTAFSARRELLTSMLSLTLKKKIVKTVIWPVLLYGCETWTLRKDEIRRIEACEMWLWRRLAKVKWSDKKTNEEVLRVVNEKRCIVSKIVNRKKNWIGHVMRGDGLLKDVTEGRMEGKRVRGRRRNGMLEELKKDGYEKMKRDAQNREAWREWKPWTYQMVEN